MSRSPIHSRIHIHNDGKPRVVEFKQNTIKVGCMKSSHLMLSDNTVARMHAVFELADTVNWPPQIKLTDLGSQYGTHVNGRLCRTTEVKFGDLIQFGDVKVSIETAPFSNDIHGTRLVATSATDEALKSAITQMKISLECGPGSTQRDVWVKRTDLFRRELANRREVAEEKARAVATTMTYDPYRGQYNGRRAYDSTDPAVELDSLKRLLADMIRDRDAWQKDGERLQETVRLRDREIALLTQQLHEANARFRR